MAALQVSDCQGLRSLVKVKELTEFTMRCASRPSRWGELDCALAVADWIAHLTGSDPASEFRGRYKTGEAALALIKSHGGFLALLTTLAARAGLPETLTPEIGDVALVQTVRGQRCVPHLDGAAAICLGKLWMVKAPMGVMAQPFDVLKAWRV